nr:hypothetical protein Iba_chr13cCG11740 [Ipomoea batatas]
MAVFSSLFFLAAPSSNGHLRLQLCGSRTACGSFGLHLLLSDELLRIQRTAWVAAAGSLPSRPAQAVRNDGGFNGLSLLPPATNSDEVFSSKLRPSPPLGTNDGRAEHRFPLPVSSTACHKQSNALLSGLHHVAAGSNGGVLLSVLPSGAKQQRSPSTLALRKQNSVRQLRPPSFSLRRAVTDPKDGLADPFSSSMAQRSRTATEKQRCSGSHRRWQRRALSLPVRRKQSVMMAVSMVFLSFPRRQIVTKSSAASSSLHLLLARTMAEQSIGFPFLFLRRRAINRGGMATGFTYLFPA